MSQEIRATSTLSVTKNGFTSTGNLAHIIDMSGSNFAGTVYTIGTSYFEIPTGSCADLRYLFVGNQSTASVDVAVNAGSSSFAVLRGGDTLLIPPPETHKQYYLKSSMAGTDVQVVITEK